MDERALAWLVGTILVLFGGAVVFAGIAMWMHWIRRRRRQRMRKLHGWWGAVLSDVLAGDESPAALWSLVSRKDEMRFLDFLVDHAMRLRGDELERLRELAFRALCEISFRFERGGEGRRARDARALALLGLPLFETTVVRALDDPSPLVSQTAMHAVCRPENGRYASIRAFTRASRFVEWNPRFLGLLIARFGAAAATPCREMLASEGQVRARIAAAYALAQIADANAASVAARILEAGAPGPDLAAACLRLLERVGRDIDAPVARRYLDHPAAFVRSAAVGAFSTAADPSDLPRLERLITDPSPWVGLRAAAVLAHRAPSMLQRIAAGPRGAEGTAIAREALAGLHG